MCTLCILTCSSESDLVQQLTSATGLIYLDEGGVSKWVDPSLLKLTGKYV